MYLRFRIFIHHTHSEQAYIILPMSIKFINFFTVEEQGEICVRVTRFSNIKYVMIEMGKVIGYFGKLY